MQVGMIFGGILIGMFVLGFFSQRRFGVLALALAAGSVLASIWSKQLGDVLEQAGLEAAVLPVGVISSVVLLIAPALLLVLGGPKHHEKSKRAVAALAFAVLGAAFLVEPMGSYITLSGDALTAYTWLLGSYKYVITAGLVLGVLDMFVGQNSKHKKPKH